MRIAFDSFLCLVHLGCCHICWYQLVGWEVIVADHTNDVGITTANVPRLEAVKAMRSEVEYLRH